MNILQELLDAVTEKSLATPAMLARHLNISQELVDLMLAELERMGYLQAVTGECNGCAGCGIRQACPTNQPRLWIRTGR